jgi:putative phosphoribosyl transferase
MVRALTGLGSVIGHFTERTFQDRRDAGRVLARMLAEYRDRPDVWVLGLARGGVPVAAEIAAALHAPLDVFVVRKLGVPRWPELAMGAIASGGGIVVNEDVVRGAHVSEAQLQAVIAVETEELRRREATYRGAAPPVSLADKTVILADDGIATGATMLAAVRAVRGAKPARVIVAVPVGPHEVRERLRGEADDVVIATMPRRFEAVGQVFADFGQVSDDEVRAALQT